MTPDFSLVVEEFFMICSLKMPFKKKKSIEITMFIYQVAKSNRFNFFLLLRYFNYPAGVLSDTSKLYHVALNLKPLAH